MFKNFIAFLAVSKRLRQPQAILETAHTYTEVLGLTNGLGRRGTVRAGCVSRLEIARNTVIQNLFKTKKICNKKWFFDFINYIKILNLVLIKYRTYGDLAKNSE